MTPTELAIAEAEAEVAAARERLRVLRELVAESTSQHPARPPRPSVTRPDGPVDNLAVEKVKRAFRRRGIEVVADAEGGEHGAA